jgi:CSLREA domain-containing protein
MTTISKRTRNLIRGAMLLALLTAWLAAPRVLRQWAQPTVLAAPMTFEVNTVADSDDGVCSPAASGCMLREAINAANSNPGPDTINFDIPGPGVKTIHLTSNLPFAGPGVTIDGYTQGLATPNTLAVGDNALLFIELDASGVSEPGWPQKLEDNEQAYAELVVTSPQFVTQYPLNQSADTYVDALFASAGVCAISIRAPGCD